MFLQSGIIINKFGLFLVHHVDSTPEYLKFIIPQPHGNPITTEPHNLLLLVSNKNEKVYRDDIWHEYHR